MGVESKAQTQELIGQFTMGGIGIHGPFASNIVALAFNIARGGIAGMPPVLCPRAA